MQFVNISLVVLLINFNFSDKKFLGFIPILNGTHPDFTSYWYSQIGKQLCLTLLLNIFTPHFSKIGICLLKLVIRFFDRGCNMRLRKKEDGQELNTKKMLQTELNALYTGDQISSHYVYAQNFTYLWCVLMFSAGLPILYPFAFIFYFVLYWVYKVLLLKFYARTIKFNEELP